MQDDPRKKQKKTNVADLQPTYCDIKEIIWGFTAEAMRQKIGNKHKQTKMYCNSFNVTQVDQKKKTLEQV